MPVLETEQATIPYEIRRSRKARRLRITVRPEGVVAVAPIATGRSQIRSFVESKAGWITRKTLDLAERDVLGPPERFETGSPVRFRDRWYPLEVLEDRAGSRSREVAFKEGLRVHVEGGLDAEAKEEVVRGLVLDWLRQRALEDAERWASSHRERLGVRPSRIRIGNQKTLWGSCSPKNVVSLNWRLIAAPPPVFEYVVVHELCHLVERNHGPRFWALVAEVLPEFEERRAWLKRRGIGLG